MHPDTYYVVAHCKHSAPVGPCGVCAVGDGSGHHQPQTLAGPLSQADADFSAANRAALQPRWSPLAYSVVNLGFGLVGR